MKLIVITSDKYEPHEIKIIHQLFEHGLEILHLRKPMFTIKDQEYFLGQISPDFHDKIALHQHHILSEQYPINRLHFSEKGRIDMMENTYLQHKNSGKIISTSFHNTDDLMNTGAAFNYAFLGPVFDSISKQGYKEVFGKIPSLKKEQKFTKTLGIGGINNLNIKMLYKLNFDGAAVLGAVWQNPEKALESFIQLKQQCQ